MARILGVELVFLLTLGFIIGILLFMYLETRLELSTLLDEKEKLAEQVMEWSSEINTYKYKKNLAEANIEQARSEDSAKVQEIFNLTQRVSKLQEQLVSIKCRCHDVYIKLYCKRCSLSSL